MGSVITYGRRYLFQGLLGINAEDDDDGAAAEKAKPAIKEYKLKAPPPVATGTKAVEGSGEVKHRETPVAGHVAPSAPSPAEPTVVPDDDNQDAQVERAKILMVSKKEGVNKKGAPWTKYGIKIACHKGEIWLNSWDTKLGGLAEQWEGKDALVTYKKGDPFHGRDTWNLEDLTEPSHA